MDKGRKLPAPDFCNKEGAGKPNPIPGMGALGNQYTGRMFYTGSNKEDHVTLVQMMLTDLGYDVGPGGADGKFGNDTEKAVKKIQETHEDWGGEKLNVDGLVGPETADALNRAMVPVEGWYDFHQTETSLTIKFSLLTAKAEALKNPISLDVNGVEKGKIVLVGEIPYDTQTSMEIRFSNEWDEPIPGLPISITTSQGEKTGPTNPDGLIRVEGVLKDTVGVKISDFEAFAQITEGWQEREARTDNLPEEKDWMFLTPRDLSKSTAVPISKRINIMVMTRADIVYCHAYSKWENPHLDAETGPWKLKVDQDGIMLSFNSNGMGDKVTVLSSQPIPGKPGKSAEVKWFEVNIDDFKDSQQHQRTAELDALFAIISRDPPDQEDET